jgi:hypothetical protein
VKDVLQSLSSAGWEGGPGKMARVGRRVGLGNIARDHFVCGLGMWTDRVRRMDWGLYPGPSGMAER